MAGFRHRPHESGPSARHFGANMYIKNLYSAFFILKSCYEIDVNNGLNIGPLLPVDISDFYSMRGRYFLFKCTQTNVLLNMLFIFFAITVT